MRRKYRNAIPRDEVNLKLNELEKHMPNPDPTVCKFGRYLATRVKSELVIPEGFVMGCEIVLLDLSTGVDLFRRTRITSELVGQPPMVYEMLRNSIPHIAEAIFPEDFATAVKEAIPEVNKKLSAYRA
jgi:hypothetical protein